MRDNENRIDWRRVIIHFVVGAVVGGAIGAGYWIFDPVDTDTDVGVVLVVAGAVLVGTLAAIFGDRFWESLKDSSWWHPWRRW